MDSTSAFVVLSKGTNNFYKNSILGRKKLFAYRINNREFLKGGVGDEEFIYTLFWPRRKGRARG